MTLKNTPIDTQIPEVKFALYAVRQASQLVRQIQAELVTTELTKNDRSPVTVADFASQALVGYLLSRALPGERGGPRLPLVAEEDSQALQKPESRPMLEQVTEFVGRFAAGATPEQVCQWIDYGQADAAGRFWTLDPIDGTKGFLRGEQYVVALALVQDGQPQVGVLGVPNLADAYRPTDDGPGSLVIAGRGAGAWTTPLDAPGHYDRLSVSERADPAAARILRSVEAGHTNIGQVDLFAQALGVQAPAVHMDSQAKYVVLAAGRGDIYLRLLSPGKLDYREKIWDQAAGALILQEAGGQITDLDGNPLDFSTGRSLKNNRGILASNGYLHAAALQALRQVGA